MALPGKTAVVALPLALVSPSVRADIGVPVVAVFLPAMWLAFIPIVLVEALVLARLLDLSFARVFAPAFLANLASTFIGVPLTWFALAILELICCGTARGLDTLLTRLYAVTVQAPWLIPYEQDLWWMVPCALTVIAIPCLVVSVMIEAPVNGLLLRDVPRRSLWRATAIANVWSYAALGLLLWPASKLADRTPGVFGSLIERFVDITFKVVGALTGKH